MKYFNSLLFTLLLLCGITQLGHAQDYEVRSRTASTGVVAVDVRYVGSGTAPQAGTDFLSDFTVELRYPQSAQLDFDRIINMTGYNMRIGSPEANDGSDEYIGFGLTDFLALPETWTTDEWIEIFQVALTGDGSSDEIVAVGALGTSPLQPNGIPNVGINGLDQNPTVTGPAASLPVELARFDARRTSATSARLDWSTSIEENTSHFEVERSVDANTWSVIAKVNAAGNSERHLAYEAYDKDIDLTIRQAGTVFYRLHIVDFDGHTDYSPIKAVAFETGAVTLNVYPNPTTDQVTIMTDEELLSVTVYDAQGRQLLTSQRSRIDLGAYPAGTYRLKIETENGRSIKTIVRAE